MIAYLLEVLIAGTVSYFIYDWHWWLSTISFPLIMMIGNQSFSRAMIFTRYRLILDNLITVVMIGYVIIQAIIFQKQFGNWYGWIIGIVVGWLVMGFMTPKRWKEEVNVESRKWF
ncbi:hypothetical protein M3194_15650 [Paenibacillus glycanilyticus]|uniref:hypothetical protein n=1 Tax=Paenibacillus glycanilyticus TaxID=126569 RepID=UPI00203D5007|nr:hypothetical protein [Paenibacillus glycanilyticus]MCM3628778.1 hypothetical protein [Paenibacillus glycanilyticus]